MNKKDWKDRLASITKLRDEAKFREKKAIEDQEELNFMISAMKDKIQTFK
ncbi:hypothetical protein KAR91_65735 [Candidatus Pacearchaeota archaeon]|nr:hypothetical protein [Candidatus Pacearchaeota archaeon]